jgi:hypothetical protein
MNKLLSVYHKIATTASIGVRAVEYPNSRMAIGMCNQLMGALPQIAFYNPEIIKPVTLTSDMIDNGTTPASGEAISIPSTTNYYIGEGDAPL